MKQAFRAIVSVTLLLGLAPSALADLGGDVRAILSDKIFSKGQVGVEIIRLSESDITPAQPVFEYNGKSGLIPASNLKLATTAAAIETLGADFQFKTVLAGRGQDLALVGDGDPTLGDAEMLKKFGWGVDTVFKTWADMLKQRGITQVRDVFVDDSIFDQVFAHPDWPADQEHKRYQCEVAGVNLNFNCVDFYLHTTSYSQPVEFRLDPPTEYVLVNNTCVTGDKNAVWLSRQRNSNDVILRGETNAGNDVPVSVTIHDPAMFAATVLAETLNRNGVRVTGKVDRDRTIRAALNANTPGPDRWAPLGIHSTPMVAVLGRTNKDSKNLYAESLCKRTGAKSSGASGSWANGTASVGAFLRQIGVSADEFSLADGSGLSKKNQISPNALVRVLEHEFHGHDREVFLNSLSVAATDGTLEDRFRDSDLRGRVFGKSGTVAGVRSLSGYLKTRDGQWYVFSILMNSLPDLSAEARAKLLQEKIVEVIDGPRPARIAR